MPKGKGKLTAWNCYKRQRTFCCCRNFQWTGRIYVREDLTLLRT